MKDVPCNTYPPGTLLMKYHDVRCIHNQLTPLVIYARGRFRSAFIKGAGPRFAICQYKPLKGDVKTDCIKLDKLYELVDPTTTTIAQFIRNGGGRIIEQKDGRRHWFVKLDIAYQIGNEFLTTHPVIRKKA